VVKPANVYKIKTLVGWQGTLIRSLAFYLSHTRKNTMTAPTIQYTERRGKYNLYADPKLEKLIEEIVPIGSWGKFDRAVAKLARHRKSVEGGRMRDHQRVIARQLLKVLKSKERTARAVAELVAKAA
jgi:hypothetical protein